MGMAGVRQTPLRCFEWPIPREARARRPLHVHEGYTSV
eukprot:UN19966